MELLNNLTKKFDSYACNVYINDTLLSSFYQIISVQVKQAYQYISSAHILIKQNVDFENPMDDFLKNNAPLAGSHISIKANSGPDELTLFDGYIVKHSYKNSKTGTRLQLTAKNIIVNMSMNKKAEIFRNQNDKDLIETIVQNNGFTLQTSSLATLQLNTRHTQLVKNEVSDWDYINIRAEANNCFVYTERDTVYIDKPTLEINPEKIINANYGLNVYELQIDQDDRNNNVEYEYIAFDTSSLERYSENEELFDATNSKIKGKNTKVNYGTFNEQEIVQQLNSITQLKTISTVNGMVHIHANLEVKPGNTISIAGYNEIVNKSYIITAVTHDFSEGSFSTYILFGLQHECFATKYKLNKNANAASVILSGIVMEIEQDPDNLYRVLVQIPTWKYAYEGIWARMLTAYAGEEYGLIILPEIGDEVIISFMGNDYNTPIVLGSSFNPKTPPHTINGNDNYEKILITKSGMKWAWNEEKKIHEISTPSGNIIILSEEEKKVIIQDQSKNMIEMSTTGIQINSDSEIKIKSTTSIKLEATNIKIDASGINTIKGSMVKIN